MKKILSNPLILALFVAALFTFSGLGASSSEDDSSAKEVESSGSCSCELIDEKCRVSRNKCKSGYKPRCIDLGDDKCDCECVQK